MNTGNEKDHAELIERIQYWKEKRNAVILAHNYQRGEVQDVADYSGDSLELARKAAETKAETIVFCGVHFMAESAKILSPAKTVLLPVREAGCPMADMITAEELKKKKADYPDAVVVAYVNSSAEVKAESDYCCTSANAVNVVNSIPEKEILFVPDKNLGGWVAKHTDKNIHLWDGFCATHDMITTSDVYQAREAYPQAELLVHPECRLEISALADAVLSTSQMIRYAKESDKSEFIVGTETGLLHTLRKMIPGKTFHALTETMICPNMKLTTLYELADALEFEKEIIDVSSDVRHRAVKALEAMLRYS